MRLLSNIMIPMRDGKRLATDIYIPKNIKLPLPVVIERTPYNKNAPSRSEININGEQISREAFASTFNKYGFVMIFQDCRGRYKSEGEFVKYINEAHDGLDTYEWILNQEWCNGSIGSLGLSYAAHTQLAVACLNPKGLKTMVLDSGGFSNSFQCGIRQGGAFELKQATWAYKQALLSPLSRDNETLKKALEQEDIYSWFKMMPWKRGHSPLRHIKEYEDYLLKQWQNGDFNDYWKQLGIYAKGYYKSIPDIPILCMSSWYDAYVSSTLDNFSAFCNSPYVDKAGESHIRKSKQHLIMGPWLHGDRNITFSGDVEFGHLASFDRNIFTNWLDFRIHWFTKYLKNENQKNESEEIYELDLFIMGGDSEITHKISTHKTSNGKLYHGGYWHKDCAWPPSNAKKLHLYLNNDNMNLSPIKSEKINKFSFQSDPKNPIPTIGGSITSGLPIFVGGAFNQVESPLFFGSKNNGIPLSARADILVFQTELLEKDLIVAGPIKVVLYFDSDCLDIDFTVKLVDVYPPCKDYPKGYDMNITDGIMRTRYRESWEYPKMLQKGEITNVVITPFATCNAFKKGHRLRLDIAGSNFPHFDCNPNSGEAQGYSYSPKIATNNIYIGGIYASFIELFILE